MVAGISQTLEKYRKITSIGGLKLVEVITENVFQMNANAFASKIKN
jgi:hypothetical protein